MIQMQTILKVADNTGAKSVMCIKVLGGSQRRVADLGDEIVVSIREICPKSKIKKGSVQRAVIVRTKKGIQRRDGSKISFDQNAVVLLKSGGDGDPLGTRIFGPVVRELRRDGKHTKIVSLAPEVW